MNNSNTLFLYNPQSNENKAIQLWNKIAKTESFLPKTPIDVNTISDLSSFISKQKPTYIVIAGGDGTINRVCNALVATKLNPTLALLPLGFGNALSYCFGVETIEKALYVMKHTPSRITIDCMKTNLPNHQLGTFNISVGFDARIVYNRMHHRYIGFRSYILSAVRSFLRHSNKQITFTINKETTITASASSLVIANAPVIGQNYLTSPFALLNDGFLDCTLFSTKYAYLTNLRLRGFKHPLYSEEGKMHFKATHIRIEGEPFIQIDGDPVVHKEGLEIEIKKSQFTFLRNSEEKISQVSLPFV